jgi:SAM-dependent methyltransferase
MEPGPSTNLGSGGPQVAEGRGSAGPVSGGDPFAGDDDAKYGSTNPVVRALLRRWLDELAPLVTEAEGPWIDVGSGSGNALLALGRPGPVVAVELRPVKLALARSRVPRLAGTVGDARHLPLADGCAGLVTCIEVLEHLDDPVPAVAELARVTAGRCVVSVPHEPWFRLGSAARGRHLARLGNHPEHVQQFSPAGLDRLLSTAFARVEIRRATPWLLAVADRPRRAERP